MRLTCWLHARMADQPKMATMAQRVLQYMSTGYTKGKCGKKDGMVGD
jgi:hypothetical protein